MQQNEQKGLYAKYILTKADGTPVNDRCFILKPDKDPAAVKALQAYAAATDDELLRNDLYAWVGKSLQKPLTLDDMVVAGAVWLEDNDKETLLAALGGHVVDYEIFFHGRVCNIVASLDEYGIRWRAWASCPTDEERKAAPWEV